jgi:hypothetical protein
MCSILNQYIGMDMIYNIYWMENDLQFVNSKKYTLSILVNLFKILDLSEQIDNELILIFEIKKTFTNLNFNSDTQIFQQTKNKFCNNSNMSIHIPIEKINEFSDIKQLCSFHTKLDNLNNLSGIEWSDSIFCDSIMNDRDNLILYWMELNPSNYETSSSSTSTASSISFEKSDGNLNFVIQDDEWLLI